MPKKNYSVLLNEHELMQLKEIVHNGHNHSAKEILHANILRLTDDNRPKGKKAIRKWPIYSKSLNLL